MYEIQKLSNGLKVILEYIPFVRSVSFGIWVKNGSRNENIETNGISHFIEHMLFKGTYNRSAKDIADEMDMVGGHLNAYTSKDYTCYYTKSLSIHLDKVLEVMSDMLLNSKFSNEDIKKELNVILEEIDMYEDSPDELVNDVLQEIVWKDMPLGRPILGTEEVISKFNHFTFEKYYTENYNIDNTVLAIAGNFDKAQLIEMLEKYFGVWNNYLKINNTPAISIYTPALEVREKDIEQLHICLGFRGENIYSKNMYIMNVFNTIFGDGMSSRLFQKIREDRGLAYTVFSDNYNYIDDGLFTIYAGLAVSQVEEVIYIIKKEIELIKKDYSIEKDVVKAKELIKSNYLIGLESTSNRMSILGRSELLLEKIRTEDEVIKEIDAITTEDILNIAKKVLDWNNVSLSAVGKVDSIDFKRILKG